jgi:flagellar biosynthesis/type III secretory pathway chaperone
MTGAVDELLDLLSEEAQELRHLLPVLEDQQRALLDGNAPRVADLARRQETFAEHLAGLESGRRRLVAQVAADLGVAPGLLTLSTLADRLPDPPARLGALRNELRALLASLGALNRRNAFLLARSAEYLEGLLAHIVSVLSPSPTYGRQGHQGGAVPAVGLLDRRA